MTDTEDFPQLEAEIPSALLKSQSEREAAWQGHTYTKPVATNSWTVREETPETIALRAELESAAKDKAKDKVATRKIKMNLKNSTKLSWINMHGTQYFARLPGGEILKTWCKRDEAGERVWWCWRNEILIGTSESFEGAKKKCESGMVSEMCYDFAVPTEKQALRNLVSKKSAVNTNAGPLHVKPRPANPGKSKLAGNLRITVLVKENPKRGDARRRFDLYATCGTVEEYVAVVGDLRKAEADIKWDSKQGWIKLEEKT